jgi:hypothetical protein
VADIFRSLPSVEALDQVISMSTLQTALLQQQYAPNHPLFSKNPLVHPSTLELRGSEVGTSDFGSDRVTVGDDGTVIPSNIALTNRFKAGSLFLRLPLQPLVPQR